MGIKYKVEKFLLNKKKYIKIKNEDNNLPPPKVKYSKCKIVPVSKVKVKKSMFALDMNFECKIVHYKNKKK